MKSKHQVIVIKQKRLNKGDIKKTERETRKNLKETKKYSKKYTRYQEYCYRRHSSE